MGRGRPGTGVEPRENCIRIRFTWSGKRRTETLQLKPTPANIRAAARLVAIIKQEIDLGLFDYARHFPASRTAGDGSRLFKRYAKLYLEGIRVEHSTMGTYRSPIARWVRVLGDRPIQDITRSEISVCVADAASTLSGGTLNSYVSVLRAIFDVAVNDKLIDDNPTSHLKSSRHQIAQPSPLSRDETERFIAHLDANAPEQVAAFYELAFLTGLRPSEMIALRWGKVDWGRKTVLIDIAHVRRLDKVTKTAKVRDVDLSDRAIQVLTRMKRHTWDSGFEGHVFLNPRTKLPWRDNEEQRTLYWLPTLKALGMRARDAYQTRHTYATTMLMAGVDIHYIARQLGHSHIEMTLKHYAKWVSEFDNGRQASAANKVFAPRLPPRAAGHLKLLKE